MEKSYLLLCVIFATKYSAVCYIGMANKLKTNN